MVMVMVDVKTVVRAERQSRMVVSSGDANGRDSDEGETFSVCRTVKGSAGTGRGQGQQMTI